MKEVEINSVQINANQFWARPFNKCSFTNLGGHTVLINNIPILAGQALAISLNVGEVNTTTFMIDFGGNNDANLWVLSTEYKK